MTGAELDPDELTRLLTVQPTASGKRGDPLLGAMSKKKGETVAETFWEIELMKDSYSTDEGVQEILSLVWESREALVSYLQVRPSIEASFILLVKIIYYRPAYELSQDSLVKLAHLGCDFRIDEICDLRTSNVYDLDEYENGR